MTFKKLLLLTAIPAFLSHAAWAQTMAAAGGPATPRTIDQLVDGKDNYLATLQQMAGDARNKVTLLPATRQRADSTILALQVNNKTALGAVVHETGGILIDNGWIRLLGSGSAKINRDIVGWNYGKTFRKTGQQPTFLLVGDDVLGGLFAINNGGLGDTSLSSVFYFAPDTQSWESLGMNYTGFLHYICNANLNDFYEGLRWKTWQQDISTLSGDDGYTCYPYLFTEEAKDIDRVVRTIVPMQDLWDFDMNNKGR